MNVRVRSLDHITHATHISGAATFSLSQPQKSGILYATEQRALLSDDVLLRSEQTDRMTAMLFLVRNVESKGIPTAE